MESDICYGVFEWPPQVGWLRWTAGSYREGETDFSPARLVQTCETWDFARRLANNFNLLALEQRRCYLREEVQWWYR